MLNGPPVPSDPHVRWLDTVRRADIAVVGGKNASLGELVHGLSAAGIRVPPGFATTAWAYDRFLDDADLRPQIASTIADLHAGRPLPQVGAHIRAAILRTPLPTDLTDALDAAYDELSRRCGVGAVDVAVRSSAIVEDLPEASFAGQQESVLNITGHDQLHRAVHECFASLFTDRAIAYRHAQEVDSTAVALSVGVQQMVRSDLGGAGVMFTLDPDSGFPHVVRIDAAWGLGESVVSGTVDPDGYTVFTPLLDDPSATPILEKRRGAKETRTIYAEGGNGRTVTVAAGVALRDAFVLTDDEIVRLARWAKAIEDHYGCPMAIGWAKDGRTGEIFIVQARPETTQSRRPPTAVASYRLVERGDVIVEGLAVGQAIATGAAALVRGPRDFGRFPDGAVLVAERTDPDWVPLMQRASAIVTDHGGRTAHAAIVSRELGVPAVVGTGNATTRIRPGQDVTVSCAEGETGQVLKGRLAFLREELDLSGLPETRTRLMLNVATPDAALRWWRLPARGIGLARMEFVVSNHVGVHPLALTRLEQVEDPAVRQAVERLTAGYADRTDYFRDRLAHGLAKLAASVWPEPAMVRMSDFNTNEYAGLLGGAQFESTETNPMMGFRGASRYHSPGYRDGFALECAAVRMVRESIGLRNVRVMVPFVRTVEEADKVLEVMAEEGLVRGRDGLEIWMMAEVPSNVVLAEEFAQRFDGFSIGSNDLTQLVLGIDRDNAALAASFDERDPAVTRLIEQLVDTARAHGVPVGICGQGPSDHPDFLEFLVGIGIDSMSLNPDSLIGALRHVAAVERHLQPVDLTDPSPSDRSMA